MRCDAKAQGNSPKALHHPNTSTTLSPSHTSLDPPFVSLFCWPAGVPLVPLVCPPPTPALPCLPFEGLPTPCQPPTAVQCMYVMTATTPTVSTAKMHATLSRPAVTWHVWHTLGLGLWSGRQVYAPLASLLERCVCRKCSILPVLVL